MVFLLLSTTNELVNKQGRSKGCGTERFAAPVSADLPKFCARARKSVVYAAYERELRLPQVRGEFDFGDELSCSVNINL